MTDSSVNSKGYWLQNTLTDVLHSPHISIRALPGIRMGPGPIDLFSTKFNNAFAPDVNAIVAGEQVDREGLKEKLLALQRHYTSDNVQILAVKPGDTTNAAEGEPDNVRLSVTGTSQEIGEYEVSITAAVDDTERGRKVSFIEMQGTPESFAVFTT